MKILAIDDNADNLTTIDAVIRDAIPGARVLVAHNGVRGIDLARAEDPDVILLDVVMPNMDGFEVCRQLKADGQLSLIPVLFLTALRTDRASRVRALNIGAEGFLSKPLDEAELIAQIRAMARIKAAHIAQSREQERLAVLVEERTRALSQELAAHRKSEEALQAAYRDLQRSETAVLNVLEDLRAENEARKKSEEELRESEEKFRAIADYTMDLETWFGPDGKFIWISKSVEALTGYTPEEIMAMPDFAATTVAEQDQERFITTFQAMMRGDRGRDFEFRCRRKDGRVFWLSASWGPIFDAQGNFLGVRTSSRDISERKQAEEDRTRLMTAVEHAGEVIIVTDSAGVFQYVNPQFVAVTGYSPAEVIGQTPRILKSGMHTDAFYQAMWETIAAGRVWKGRIINKRKDGAHYTEDATITPVVDSSGKIVNFVAVKRDITEHLNLEAQLIQSQKMESIGTLAGGVAHEINNPIMGIMGYAQLILDGLDADSPLVEFARGIEEQTERVAALVKDLLRFSRQETDQQRRPARMRDIVDGSLSLIRTVMRHDDIALKVDVSGDLPEVLCRSGQIQQVLMNLLTNARDATNLRTSWPEEKDKAITIAVRCMQKGAQQWVRTTVEDHGIGIEESVRQRMFDPFFTTKPRDKGTGLGLSISLSIIKAHGGDISVESEVGQGTRFHVDLPVE